MQVTAAIEVTVNGWRQVIGPVTYETDEHGDAITAQLCDRLTAAVNAEVARNHAPAQASPEGAGG